MSVLALLDFSSAFDTIYHPILVHRLHADFGFTDTVLHGFHLIGLIVHTTSLYLIIVLLLLLYTQVFLSVQFLAPYFSPCILSLCLPLLTHTLSYTIHFVLSYNYGYLLSQIEYLSYFTLCSHVYVMSKLGRLRTFLNLMTTRQSSCLSPPKEVSISITYLLQSLLAILKFPSYSL